MTTTAQERNEQVKAVLDAATGPMGPSYIALAIKQPWCYTDGFASSAAITPVCRRIGAVNNGKGKWSKPEAGWPV